MPAATIRDCQDRVRHSCKTSSRMTSGHPRQSAQEGELGRQVRSRANRGAADRCPGRRPADADAARQGRQGRPQHGGLRDGLSRLADRRARGPVAVRRQVHEGLAHRLQAGPERGSGGDGAVGLTTNRAAQRRQVRRRLRRLVRQGSRRRSHRRRLPACQSRRHGQARRRHRPDGRRSHLRKLDQRAPERVRLPRRHDARSQSGRRAGDHRLRPARHRHVALRRRLGRHQVREGQHRVRPPRPMSAWTASRPSSPITRCRRAASTSA